MRRARVWQLYMAASANGFVDGGISVHQVLGVVPGPDGQSGMPSSRGAGLGAERSAPGRCSRGAADSCALNPCRRAARSSCATATRPDRSCWKRRCGCSTPTCSAFDLELVRFDLSLENRRATANEVVHEAADAMRETGLGLKAATVTPETTGDVGSPNRILREGIGGSVIVRTGRRIPVSRRRPPSSTRSWWFAWPSATRTGRRSAGPVTPAARPNRRGGPSASTARRAGPWPSTRSAPPRRWARACTAAPSGPSRTVYEGMLKEEMDDAAARYPDMPYRPTLIDAAYAGTAHRVERQPTGRPGPQPRR